MIAIAQQISLYIGILIMLPAAMMHFVKREMTAVWLYVFQSMMVVIMMAVFSVEGMSLLLVAMLAITILVKVVIAPFFFFRLIKKHQFKFSVKTYLNGPVTFFLMIGVLAVLQSLYGRLPTPLVIYGENVFIVFTAAFFISLLLLINRKGVLSQALGILSLENSIIAFSILIGLEQSPGLEIGVIFDILLWVVIASIFVSMIYSHFGSLDVTEMKELTD